MADNPSNYNLNATQKARPGRWVRFNDMYGSGLRRVSYDGRFVYETHYDKVAGQPKTVNVWGADIATLPAPPKPGNLTDVAAQIDRDKKANLSDALRGQATQMGIKTGLSVSLSSVSAGGPAAIATPLSTGTAATATGAGIATSAGAAVTAALAVPAVLTGILKLTGKQPFKSPVANPVFGTAEPGIISNALPGNPGYKNAQFIGGQPTGKTIVQGAEISGREAKELKKIDIPESIRGDYRKEQEYKEKYYLVDDKMRHEFGVALPQGTAYPHYNPVTRYSDEAHGSKPVTYQNKGPEGEVVVKILDGGLGLTNQGRVLSGPTNKWGVPIDIGGEKSVAIRTSYYVKRALLATGGKIDNDTLIQISKERAQREINEELKELKPKTVAGGSYDNPIGQLASQTLMGLDKPGQAAQSKPNTLKHQTKSAVVDEVVEPSNKNLGHISNVKTNRSTGIKTITTDEGKVYSQASGRKPYFAGYDQTQVLANQQQNSEQATKAFNIGAAGDWGAAATYAKQPPTPKAAATTPPKPVNNPSLSAYEHGRGRPSEPETVSAGSAHDPHPLLPQEHGQGHAMPLSTSLAEEENGRNGISQSYGTAGSQEKPAFISQSVAEAAGLPTAAKDSGAYGITDLSNPPDTFAAPKMKATPIDVMPLDPGQNLPTGERAIF